MIVEASWGLGEAVVSGLVEPDRWLLERATGLVVEERIGAKQRRIDAGGETATVEEARGKPCLNGGELRKLWEMGQRVEAVFGAGQDVEWAFDGAGELFCLQVRAITTLGGGGSRVAEEALAEEIKGRLIALRATGRGEWARHNLGETLPAPTPLTWSVWRCRRKHERGRGGYGELYRMAGFVPGEAVRAEGFLELIGGRIYMDLSRGPEMFCEACPLAYDVARLRRRPEEAAAPPTVAFGGVSRRWKGNRVFKKGGKRCAVVAQGKEDRAVMEKMFSAYHERIGKTVDRPCQELSAEEWSGEWRRREEAILGKDAPEDVFAGDGFCAGAGRIAAVRGGAMLG